MYRIHARWLSGCGFKVYNQQLSFLAMVQIKVDLYKVNNHWVMKTPKIQPMMTSVLSYQDYLIRLLSFV